MKCAKLNLQERCKSKTASGRCCDADKPLRYCQKRMINPNHEEDPRWAHHVYERFHCNYNYQNYNDTIDNGPESNSDHMFLSVQTLQFQGKVEPQKRSRNNFKFLSQSASVGAQHRMFVKQQVDDDYDDDDDRSSQLTNYFDDYVKYLFASDKSRPTSGKSSIFLQSSRNKENKATQVDEPTVGVCKKSRKFEGKGPVKNYDEQDIIDEMKNQSDDDVDSKIGYHKSGMRKSITISRAQSPETVQVIRVDVIRNQSRGSVHECEDKKLNSNTSGLLANSDNIENINVKKSHFASKYLLTNTVKTLDENLCGEKVTLLCKTFKLTQRFRAPQLNKTNTLSGTKKCSPTQPSHNLKNYVKL